MPGTTGEPISADLVLRVDVELGGLVATYWIGRAGVSYKGSGPAATAAFYLNAGRLLSDLREIDSLDSPTEDALIDRVSRIGRIVAAQPGLEAAIGFHVLDGATGLVTIANIAPDSLPDGEM
ncbi:hypothetical protein ACG04R_23255 [Roseateles sp. BYS78W]|uniref:Uncharacterized protein n=1 Tax=Pelomonas candidula TaxID=3299025 RepID=A0ABW7HI70_9BURK